MNLILEHNESGAGKSEFQLLKAPGLVSFAALSDGPVRGNGLIEINGRVFCVSGSTLFELFTDGTSSNRGNVGSDGLPVSLAASAMQVMIASAGQGYCFTLATNTLSAPIANISTPLTSGVIQVGYTDGYFVALLANSQTILLSGLLDGNTWDPAQKAIVSVFPGNIVSMIVDHREICLLGNRQSVCYYDSGNTFPYDVIPGGYMEQGSVSAFGKTKADNAYFWWGQDERGAGIAWRAQGYTPVRVSNHALEAEIQGYATISDAVSYAYQDSGHTFWVTLFPTANKTWVYDVATGQWAQRGFWSNGAFTAHRSNSHCFAFGKHLVGDWATGTIYQMSLSLQSDFGNALRPVRRSPYVASEGRWLFFDSLELEMDAGLGLATGQGSDPHVMIRWSNDRGKTWSNEIALSVGKLGEYGKRIIARRLGKCWGTIGRIFEISFTDPIPFRITDAYVEGSGIPPTDRIAAKLRAQA